MVRIVGGSYNRAIELLRQIKTQLDRMEHRMTQMDDILSSLQRAVAQLKERIEGWGPAGGDTAALQEEIANLKQSAADVEAAEASEDVEQEAQLAAAHEAHNAAIARVDELVTKQGEAAAAVAASVAELDAIAPGQVNPL